MSDEKLDYLLRKLREENAQILPPPFISTRLKAEAAKEAIRRKRRRYLAFLIPAFSVVLILAILLQSRTEPGTRLPITSSGPSSSIRKQSSHSVDKSQHPLLPTSDYFAIPWSATLPPPAETTVVRVVLKKGKLRQFGLFVSEQHSSELTEAEFVLGEDGLARSIRLVGSIDGVSVERVSVTGARS
jgi:hypothetical protein